ncbi:MAG: alpha/beta hydrolase [Thermoleophilia bacterium]
MRPRTSPARVLAACLVAASAPALAPSASGAVVPASCPPGIPQADRARVDCGHVEVPLRHEVPGSPSIGVYFARVRAATPTHADPVMLLGGGPGEKTAAATGAPLTPRAPFRSLAERRDLVVIDQRGVGLSRPALECAELASAPPTATTVDVTALLRRCGARLRSGGVDLGAFSTGQSVRDLDVLRRTLGYARVNLLGGSYGARLAQQALRGDPDWVRSVVLTSPVPAEANFVADGPRTFGRALARTFRLCAASAACRARYGDLSGTLDGAIRRLQRSPAEVPVTLRGRTVRVPVTATFAATVLFASYYSPQGIAQVPRLVADLGRGRYRALLSGAGVQTTSGSPVSLGMQLSALCQEEGARLRGSVVRRNRTLAPAPRALAAGSVVIGEPLRRICRTWGVPPTAFPTFAPVVSTVPALIVTGQLDQITAPRYGETVARQLPNSTLVEVPGAGHSALFAAGPCGIRAAAAFLDDPSAPPPVACLRRGGGR